MTESVIDLRYLAESQPSLCIPRVFNNIDEARIRQVFDQLGLGKIHHIDIVVRKNEKSETFKRVYIHFEKWFCNDSANAARSKLISGKEIKVVYDNPWFWKISANKWTPSSKEHEPRKNIQPYIDLEEAEPTRQIAPALPSHIQFEPWFWSKSSNDDSRALPPRPRDDRRPPRPRDDRRPPRPRNDRRLPRPRDDKRPHNNTENQKSAVATTIVSDHSAKKHTKLQLEKKRRDVNVEEKQEIILLEEELPVDELYSDL